MPPAATPASPMPCSARPKGSRLRSACRKMFPASASRFCKATAPTFFIPIPPTVRTAPFAWRANWRRKHPDQYFYADQYSNDANWKAHYYGTANEIWQQTQGRVTHFVSMLGTSGTFVGTTRRLKELNPSVQCISLQPDSSFHGIEGAKHMASAIVPKIYDRDSGRSESGNLHRRRLRHGAPTFAQRRIAGGNLRRGRGRRMPEDCSRSSVEEEIRKRSSSRSSATPATSI